MGVLGKNARGGLKGMGSEVENDIRSGRAWRIVEAKLNKNKS